MLKALDKFVREFNTANESQALYLTRCEPNEGHADIDLILHDLTFHETWALPSQEMQSLLESFQDADKKVRDVPGLCRELVSWPSSFTTIVSPSTTRRPALRGHADR
jgi:hypothetical protein